MIKHIQYKFSNIILIVGMILLFLFSSSAIAQNTSVLDTNVYYKAKNIILRDALTEIGSIVGYEFSYNSDIIPANNKIRINQENTSLKNLLDMILQNSTLTYTVADKQIIITKKNQLNQLMFINTKNDSLNYVNIKGTIYDKESKQGLAFANVSVKGRSIGTISNENGEFNLNISKGLLLDTVVFTYLGYKNTLIPVRNLSISENLIYLTQDNYSIKEAVIRNYNAEEILRNAISKIKVNYYTDPYLITAFYREMVMKKNELVAITEAVLDVYKSPYWGIFSDQIKLLKSRKNEYYTNSDTLALKLKGGLYASLYLDIIKNPSLFLQENTFSYYKYYMEEIVNYNNRPVYVIYFKPVGYLDENSFTGRIYIDTEQLSILAIEFTIVPDALDKIGKNLVVSKTNGTLVKPVLVKYKVSYRSINNKYFLNFVRGELDFKVKYKKKIFSTDYKTIFEFASNNIDTVHIERFKRTEVISKTDVFIDENYEYDQQFWGDYNYISPEGTLQESLIEIQKKIDLLNKEK